jgi:23S rRNA pseudouridine2605 synthase
MKHTKPSDAKEGIVLNKYLAHAGIDSRRKTVELIKSGMIRVNGQVITDPSYKVIEKDHVKVGNRLVAAESRMYILLNKPVGFVSTVSDDKNRPTVLSLIDVKTKARLYPVGRLDKDTTGLLVMTNDGELTQRLAHPSYEVQKSYRIFLDKPLEHEHLETIKEGVRLIDGRVRVDHIAPMHGTHARAVTVTLHSGRYRVVRRLFEHFGYVVKALDRYKFSQLTQQGLAVGHWRYLTPQEIESFRDTKRDKRR